MISDAEFDRWGEAAERGDYGGSKLGVLLKTNGFISPLIVARGCPSSNPNRHKEIQWQKWLFTASHGARMLRESNPRTPHGIATLARWRNQPLCQASKMQEPPQRLRRLFPQTRRVS